MPINEGPAQFVTPAMSDPCSQPHQFRIYLSTESLSEASLLVQRGGSGLLKAVALCPLPVCRTGYQKSLRKQTHNNKSPSFMEPGYKTCHHNQKQEPSKRLSCLSSISWTRRLKDAHILKPVGSKTFNALLQRVQCTGLWWVPAC